MWCHRHGGFTFNAVSQPSHLSRRLKFSVVAGHYPLPLPAMLISLWSRALNWSRSTPTCGNRHIRERFCIRLIFGAFTPGNCLHMMFWLLQSPAQATQRWGEPKNLWLEIIRNCSAASLIDRGTRLLLGSRFLAKHSRIKTASIELTTFSTSAPSRSEERRVGKEGR